MQIWFGEGKEGSLDAHDEEVECNESKHHLRRAERLSQDTLTITHLAHPINSSHNEECTATCITSKPLPSLWITDGKSP